MATATTVVSGGGSVTTTIARSSAVSGGAGVANGSVPWNTSTATPKRVPWLPRTDMAWFDPNTGKPTGAYAACMVHLFEKIIGGINAPTLPQVVTSVEDTQGAVVSASETLTQTIAYARSIDQTAAALKQVAVSNSLSGAATVPDPTTPPSRADLNGF